MNWDTIYTNFKDVLSSESLQNVLSREIAESPLTISLEKVPDSFFDGAYQIQFAGIPNTRFEINTYLETFFAVRVKFAVEINQNDTTGQSYRNAINDILSIIEARMRTESFSGILGTVRDAKASEFIFIDEAETKAIVNIDFVASISNSI